MKRSGCNVCAIKIRKIVSFILLLSMFSIMMIGCESSSSKESDSGKQSTDDIIGKYDYAAWTVWIKNDASYQVYRTKTEELIKNGTWKYDTSESVLTFAAFCDDGSDSKFVRNKENFILLDQESSKPCYYNTLSVTSNGLLDFTYSTGSLDLKFCATGDIEVSGDNRAYGSGSYVIEEDKVYAYYKYTTPSAQNYANGEMYFYIYDKTHLIPYNCIMIKDLSVTEETSGSDEQNKGDAYNYALNLIKEGKYEDAYIKLFANKDKEECSALLKNFTILPTKRIFTDSDVNITLEFQYNGKGQLLQETETKVYNGKTETTLNEYSYHNNGALAHLKSYEIVNGTSDNISEKQYDEHGNLLAGGKYYYYEYDNNGNVSYIEHRNENGRISKSESYTYDKENRLTCETSYEYGGDNRPSRTNTSEYVYNEHGDVVECKYTGGFFDTGEIYEEYTHTNKYEYSNSGKIIKEQTYLSNEYFDNDLLFTIKYSYNEYDQLEKITYTDNDEDSFTEEFIDYAFIYSNSPNNQFTEEYVFELMINIR